MYTFSNHIKGAPFVLLVLLLGAAGSGGLVGKVSCVTESLGGWLD